MRIKSPARQYAHLRKAIAGELLSGAERVRRSYREEVVRTAWNIGRILRGTLGLEDRPSAENAALVRRLSKDFGKSDSFFYDAAKFHRLYPSKAPVALSLSHYSLLIRLEDPGERLALEKKAIAEDINAKDLRMYTRLDPWQAPADGKRVVLTAPRGRLYHYRASNAPKDGRVLIDIGFGIERDVRFNSKKSFHSGLIVRAVRTVPGLKSSPMENYSAKIAPFDKNRLYTYAASLVRVIDGDTLIARVDLGFRTWITQTFRLRGIDAPEMTCALGQKAKAEVKARLAPCACLVIKTYKQEKYGRFLADVFYLKGVEDRDRILREGAFLNQELLDERLAVPYEEEG
ncbi:MAG: thermonuclease family protein [Candidatus Omnitrophota bacterium]